MNNTRLNEHISPQSMTEILREGWNRNDEDLTVVDETTNYDEMRESIEP